MGRWFVVALLATGCSRVEVLLDERVCDDTGRCLDNFECHPEQDLCVPLLPIDCASSDGFCPETASFGGRCPAKGVFVSCDSDRPDCDGGCRTCEGEGINLSWSACTDPKCQPGQIESCGSCEDDCRETVLNATPECVTAAAGFACGFELCEAGFGNADGDDTNGCECEYQGVEVCDGDDNDCSGTADDDPGPSGPPLCVGDAVCEVGVCVPCTLTDELHCGPACSVCSGEYPDCNDGQCECDDQSCDDGSYCDAGACLVCGLTDPEHCGADCTECDSAFPICVDGACTCDDDSCGPTAVCVPDAGCRTLDSFSTVIVAPARIAADGAQTATVTVTLLNSVGATLSGRSVEVISDRGALDTISAAAVTDVAGQTTVTISSSTGGVSELTALNVSDGTAVEATVRLAFAPTDFANHFTFDLPLGVPLSFTDLGGVDPARALALWNMEESTGPLAMDPLGANHAAVFPPEDFALDQGQFSGYGFLANTAQEPNVIPIALADPGGSVSVRVEGGVAKLVTGSAGVLLNSQFNISRLHQDNPLFALTDFDIQVDYTAVQAPLSIVGYNIIARLWIHFEDNGWFGVEHAVDDTGQYIWGYSRRPVDATFDFTEPGFPGPPASGTLRLTRRGSVWTSWYDPGTGFVALHEIDNGLTAPVVEVRLESSVNLADTVTLETHFDNFTVNHAPERVVVGKLGRGVRLDGPGEILQGALTASFADELSMETWMRGSGGAAVPTVMELSPASASISHGIELTAGGAARGRLSCGLSQLTSLEGGSGLLDNRWHHLAMTFGSGVARLYVDGSPTAIQSGLSCADLNDPLFFALGNSAPNHTRGITGTFDAGAVYDVGLTQGQVEDHHQRGTAIDTVGDARGDLTRGSNTAGLWDGAIRLDGSGARVNVTGAADTTGDFTLTTWLKIVAPVVGAPSQIVEQITNNEGWQVLLDDTRGGAPVMKLVGPLIDDTVDLGGVLDDQWHHLAVRRDGSEVCVAIDGQIYCMQPTAAVTWGGLIRVGGPDRADATYDELKLFGRALADDEISAEATLP